MRRSSAALVGHHPARKAGPERHTTAPGSVRRPHQQPQNRYQDPAYPTVGPRAVRPCPVITARKVSVRVRVRVRVGCAHACKSATRRRGLTQGCGSVPGRTRAPQGRAPVPNAPCPNPEACPAARPHVGLGSAAPPAIEAGCEASVGRGGAMRGCRVWPTRAGKARPQRHARAAPAAYVRF